MFVRIFCLYIVLSCFISCLFAKSVSLNELIAAEEKQRSVKTTERPKLVSASSETFLLKKPVKSNSSKSKKPKVKPGKGLPKKQFSLKNLLPELSEEISTIISRSKKRLPLDSIFKPKTEKLRKLKGNGPSKKPFSLIEEISGQESRTVGRRTSAPETGERFSLNRLFTPKKPDKSNKLRNIDSILPRGKKRSNFQLKKIFEIQSPLKPKKLSITEKNQLKRKNQSIKREKSEDEIFKRKYIPLLRSLGMLFDNIMVTEPDSEDIDRERFKRKRRKNSSKRNDTCPCNNKSNAEVITTTKETVAVTTPCIEITTLEPTATETPATTAYYTTDGDVSSVGQYTDLPSVLAGDTVSTRRDDNGFGARSSPTLHSSTERNISRDYRNSEYDTGSGQTSPSPTSHEKNTKSASRDDASGVRFGGRGTDIRRPVYRRGVDDTNDSAQGEESFRNPGGDFDGFEGQDKLEVGRNETESAVAVPKFVRGERGLVSEDSVGYNSEPLQSEEGHEKSDNYVGLNLASDQRFAVRNGSSSTEDQKTSPTNAAVISISDLNNPIIMLQNNPKHRAPYVTIIDGYSIARDKNGANKIAEQSIRIHS